MKTRYVQTSLLAIAAVTVIALTTGNVVAQDSTAAQPAATAQPAPASQPAPQLSYGVPQILQLVKANVSDSIIVNYIQNSGTIYSLKADEIVYLKQQGVSDAVLNAMLNQRSRLTGSTEPATTTATTTTASDQTDTTTAPTVTYVQSAPPSTVYIIPDTQAYQYDAWYYGGYPYYGWPYPPVSFSIGWGGYYGGYRGGWHTVGGFRGGGWHTTGGFHGGGGWHR